MSIRNYLMIKTASGDYGTWATMRREGRGPSDLPPCYEEYVKSQGKLGRTMGATSNDTDIDQVVADYYGNPIDDMVPGKAGYKMYHQKRVFENILKNRKGGGNKTLSELRGRYTSSILPTLTGGILAAIKGIKAKDMKNADDLEGLKKFEKRIAGGTGAGQLLAQLGNATGALATNFTKRRDLDALDDYYNSGWGTTLGNYLIPGMGSYNDWKNSVATDKIIEDYAKLNNKTPTGDSKKTKSRAKLRGENSNPSNEDNSNDDED